MATASSSIGPHGTSGPSGEDDKTRELAKSIAQTRNEMDQTVEALHGKLNPSLLKEEVLKQFDEAKTVIKNQLQKELHNAKESLKDGVAESKQLLATEIKSGIEDAKTALREATIGKVEKAMQKTQDNVVGTGRSFLSLVKANPVPAVLIGTGALWLWANARRVSAPGSREWMAGEPTEPTSTVVDKVKDLGAGAKQLAAQATSSLGDMAHTAGDKIGDVAHGASEKVKQAMAATSNQGRRLGGYAADAFADKPLVVGAALVAAGAALGLAVPITKRETSLMGAMRDDLFEKASGLTGDALAKVENVTKNLAHDR